MALDGQTTWIITQHNFGIGHLVRGLKLAAIACRLSPTVLVSGGPPVDVLSIPTGAQVLQLPPLERATINQSGQIPSEFGVNIEQTHKRRLEALLEAMEYRPPKVIVTEYYPFSPRRLMELMEPTIDAVTSRWPGCKFVCSLRDVPISDSVPPEVEYAMAMLRMHYVAVMSHADPSVVSLSDFPEFADVRDAPGFVHTGVLVDRVRQHWINPLHRDQRVLVSAGGGRDGFGLARAFIFALRNMSFGQIGGTIVCGPLLSPREFGELGGLCRVSGQAFSVVRSVRNLASTLGSYSCFVGQAGYNSTYEAAAAGLPMLLVPRKGSIEQQTRARAMERIGCAIVVDSDECEASMSAAVQNLLSMRRRHFQVVNTGIEATKDVLLEALR